MDNTTKTGPGRQRVFISYSNGDRVTRKAAFERSLLQLLSQPAHDYVAAMNVERVMDALQVQAASSCASQAEDDHARIHAEDADSAHDAEAGDNDLLSRLRAHTKSAACAPEYIRPPDVLQGTHNVEALAAARDLVEIAAHRPSRGIWQSLSGKGGSGKTTMLLQMACMALRRGNMTVTVIDLGTVERSNCATDKALPDVADADLVLIDNADRSPLASRQTDWWAKFAQRLPKSACVLVAMTPDTFGSANEPWRAHSGDWRDTAIGSFDCRFRQTLIARLCGQLRIPSAVTAIPDGAVKRMAEELWGDGWQLGAAVDAYSAYRHVIARQPTLEEIDKIAVNIGASAIRHVPSLETIADAVARTWDREEHPLHASQHDQGKLSRRGLVLYVAKTVTGHPLDLLATQLGIGRSAAVEAMHLIERARRQNREICQSLERIEVELGRLQ